MIALALAFVQVVATPKKIEKWLPWKIIENSDYLSASFWLVLSTNLSAWACAFPAVAAGHCMPFQAPPGSPKVRGISDKAWILQGVFFPQDSYGL